MCVIVNIDTFDILKEIYALGATPLTKTVKAPLQESKSPADTPLEAKISRSRRPKS